MNGGAARLIQVGDRISIMAFGQSPEPIIPRKIVCNERNEIIKAEPAESCNQPSVSATGE